MEEKSQSEQNEEATRRIRRLEHDLYGNGRRGIGDRVTIVETEFTTIKRLLYLVIVVSVPPLLEWLKTIL